MPLRPTLLDGAMRWPRHLRAHANKLTVHILAAVAQHERGDAITPIEMYVSLDPIHRRTPQTTKIIAEYAEKGNCDRLYAVGSARVPFASTADVRTLTVLLNGVAGNLIFDTGATFVSISSDFASRAKVATEPGSQLTLKAVGGAAFAEIGYANSISVGKAEALGVTVAVHRGNPFGNSRRRSSRNELSFEVHRNSFIHWNRAYSNSASLMSY
jgi:Aspartyl protease